MEWNEFVALNCSIPFALSFVEGLMTNSAACVLVTLREPQGDRDNVTHTKGGRAKK
jgi:hypothetical protein